MYDIVGDIHGHASRLAQLLERLGYAQDAQSWHHPARQVIFVGDFIDRGPEQVETDLTHLPWFTSSLLSYCGVHCKWVRSHC